MSTILAIAFAITAHVMLNIGLGLEKLGASRLPPIEGQSLGGNVKAFARSRVWVLGFALTNVQLLFFWLALSYGPMSLVLPLMGVGIVALVIFSMLVLGEPVTRSMWGAIAITVLGVALIGGTSSGEEVLFDYDGSLDKLAGGASVVVFVVLAAGVVIPAVWSKLTGHRRADVMFGIASGCALSLGTLGSKLITASFQGLPFVEGLSINLGRGWFYSFVVLLLLGNTGAMVLQQIGFQKGRAVILAPIFNACVVVLPSFAGVLVFDEWATYGPGIIAAKLVGFFLVLVGVVVLARAGAASEES